MTTRARNRPHERKKRSTMRDSEFLVLGRGEVGYIRTLSSAQAQREFPSIQGLPRNITLYALHAADGTPIAVTDTRGAAVGQAIQDKIEVASIH